MKLYPIAAMIPLRLHNRTAWAGHVPFAFTLVDMLRPRTIVELGVHTGVSYCAFCQAVDHLKLPTQCFGIDTWQGDISTGAYHPEMVLPELREHHDPRYGHFSELVQITTRDGAALFEDSSVDLLHIDADHRYRAVKADFERWLPKMTSRGVILFHDTAHQENHCNVMRLWEEVRYDYPSFEFLHSFGLGVLAVGSKVPKPVLDLCYLENDDPERKEILKYYENLGANTVLRQQLV